MTILSNEQIEKLRLTKSIYEQAGDAFVEACRALLTNGVTVYWDHHGHVQSGVVVKFIGNAHHPDLWVTNNVTGRTVTIDFYYIDWGRMIRQAESYARIKAEVE